jgi:hypothetical protein
VDFAAKVLAKIRCILLIDDFGTAGGSRVPLAGRQLPVVSA